MNCEILNMRVLGFGSKGKANRQCHHLIDIKHYKTKRNFVQKEVQFGSDGIAESRVKTGSLEAR